MAIGPDDLPQLWQRPSQGEMADVLRSLESGPAIWKPGRRRSSTLTARDKAAVTRWLSAIIQSPLAWIDDYDGKEELWELASKRLSERCGRTAMGDVTRSWPISGDAAGDAPFELVIKEPALTGDSLGLKTWASSYVLAQHLAQLASTSLSGPLSGSPAVLELGSGTGLLGLAAAALWRVPVYLSDLPGIVGNLRENVARNRELVESRGGSATAGALTWGGGGGDEVDGELFDGRRFKIVLAADPLYDDDHPGLLAAAIGQYLEVEDARAVVMVPLRDGATRSLLRAFRRAVLDLGHPLVLLQEDELAGQDDWVGDDESGGVRCWLGVFSRSTVMG